MRKATANICRVLVFVLFFSCGGRDDKPKYTDTPVSGDALILADETYQPLIQIQLDTFHALYPYARIKVRYMPETQLFQEFMRNDSVRLAITARSLNEEERLRFTEMRIIPRENHIAIDAVAFVMNKANPDTLLTFEQLQEILQGKAKTWRDLRATSLTDSIQVVFDRNGSSTTRYLKENFLQDDSLPANWYAIQSNAEVISYVSSSPGALGVIGVNWISDRDDPEVNEFLDKVNVVQLSPMDSAQSTNEFYKPYQAYIALKKYPLTRNVLIISREGRNGLGTGFAAFVAGDQGQRIVRLTGMLPATMPVRIVNIR